MRIAIDMDGVIADLPSGFLKTYLRLKPWENKTIDNIVNYDLDKSFNEPGLMQRVFSLPRFFGKLDPIPGAAETLRLLKNDGHEIIILTVLPHKGGYILYDKMEWLEEHIFPISGLTANDVIFCFGKQWFNGDIMIDDYPKNLLQFNGLRVLVDWPYNRQDYGTDIENNFIRVEGLFWPKFYDLVSRYCFDIRLLKNGGFLEN